MIIDDLGFPSATYPVVALRKMKGVEVRLLKNKNGYVSAEDYARAMDERTRLVVALSPDANVVRTHPRSTSASKCPRGRSASSSTSAPIATAATTVIANAGQMDTVIIYYAGHGAPESDANSPDEDGLEKYLVPYDADPNDLYTTGLPMREVETILQRLAAERVIFITDSCYSGATAGRTFAAAAHRAITSDAFLARLAKAKGRVVLTASRASERRDIVRSGRQTGG